MKFQYVAYNLEEGILKGRVEARNEVEARADLVTKGYKPLEVSKAMRLPSLEKLLLTKPKTGELVNFCRQTATMLASGANLLRVLTMLHDEAKSSGMKKVLGEIRARVEEGKEFSAALKEHPKVFDEVFVSLARVGEYTGKLGPALEELADIMSAQAEAKAKAGKTLMMPVFLIGSSFLMLGYMSFVALPPLLDVFSTMEVDVPLPTLLMVSSTEWIVAHILPGILQEGQAATQPGIPLALIATFYGYKQLRRNPKARYILDVGKTRLPLMGPLAIASELGRFTRILAVMLGNGVELPTALELGHNSSKNEAFRRAWRDAIESLETGAEIGKTLAAHKVLPTMFVELWSIGEETNTLPKSMGELADSYQKQYEDRIEGILAVAEPVSTFAVGGVVLFMALSVMKPILAAQDNLGG